MGPEKLPRSSARSLGSDSWGRARTPRARTPAVILTASVHGTMAAGQGQASSRTRLLLGGGLSEGGQGRNPGRRAALGRWPWGLLAGSAGSQPDVPRFQCLSLATSSEAVATDSTPPRTEFSICETGAAEAGPAQGAMGTDTRVRLKVSSTCALLASTAGVPDPARSRALPRADVTQRPARPPQALT